MILNSKIILHRKNVTLGIAFRTWFAKAPNESTAKIWHQYFAEILNRDYEQLPDLMLKVLRLMKQHDVGVDYDLFNEAMIAWDDEGKAIRSKIAKMVYSAHGGKRDGSGRKIEYGEPTTTIAFRVPESKADEIKQIVKSKLASYRKPSE